MDPRHFDSLTRSLANARNRRSVLKGLLGIGVTAAAAVVRDTDAARRGFAGPVLPIPCSGERCGVTCCQLSETCIDGVCRQIGGLCVPMGQLCPSNFPCCTDLVCCDTGAGYSLCTTQSACNQPG